MLHGSYFDMATSWLRAVGITTGVGGTNRFEPNAPGTRGQMAAFIFRYVHTRAAMDADAIRLGV